MTEFPLKWYSKKSVIGEGSFSKVNCYQLDWENIKQRDLSAHLSALRSLPVKVAVKVLKKDGYGEEDILRSLRHKNIVTYLGKTSYHKDQTRLVMKMYQGDLQRLLSNVQRILLEEEIAHVVRETAEGLVYLQHQNIVHRDLKPGNILFKSEEDIGMHDWNSIRIQSLTVKIADFGSSQRSFSMLSRGTTEPIGYQEYRAPEGEKGKYTTASDVYSLGAIARKMLESGGSDPAAKEGPVSMPTAKRPSWPLSRLLDSATAADPEKRPTPEELLQHEFVRQSHFCELSSRVLQAVSSDSFLVASCEDGRIRVVEAFAMSEARALSNRVNSTILARRERGGIGGPLLLASHGDCFAMASGGSVLVLQLDYPGGCDLQLEEALPDSFQRPDYLQLSAEHLVLGKATSEDSKEFLFLVRDRSEPRKEFGRLSVAKPNLEFILNYVVFSDSGSSDEAGSSLTVVGEDGTQVVQHSLTTKEGAVEVREKALVFRARQEIFSIAPGCHRGGGSSFFLWILYFWESLDLVDLRTSAPLRRLSVSAPAFPRLDFAGKFLLCERNNREIVFYGISDGSGDSSPDPARHRQLSCRQPAAFGEVERRGVWFAEGKTLHLWTADHLEHQDRVGPTTPTNLDKDSTQSGHHELGGRELESGTLSRKASRRKV